jgi:alpha-ribazole phosphatase
MILHLIRHGKTSANLKRIYCGHTDISLSDDGKQGLLEIKAEICYPEADIYIVSGLKRTIETLESLYGEKEYFTFDELVEMDFGEFEMKSYEELKDNADYIRWISDIKNEVCKGGEGEKQFRERINRGLVKILKHGRTLNAHSIVVITHGGVISTIMDQFFPNIKNFYEWQPDFGRGYTIGNIERNLYYKTI